MEKTNKLFLWGGLLIGFTVFSLLLNIAFIFNDGLKLLTTKDSRGAGAIAQEETPPAPSNQPAPSPAPAVPAPAVNQTFNIAKSDHVRGDFNAPITLVEFSDFECPFCERHYPTMNQILSNYQGKVRLVYKHFPLSFHPNAQKAAESSECAGEQDKFWEYHDKLFANQANGFSADKFKQWAVELKLNAKKFNDCLDDGKYAAKVQADFQEGSQKGVSGTPATFVNGQLVSGAVPYESFKQIIDSL
ncbi:MAG: hypothetical protein A3B94_02000 [Candidatus Jacksonbacteria bacterium RIFCSPHIGHO2_02_FULL_43_10]|nr:MAG: hypothetical protein A3B94_02000 [Candidatus Jacksonbacteria bacterium RIFCSPHIGHO2_02_FULL_43_10]